MPLTLTLSHRNGRGDVLIHRAPPAGLVLPSPACGTGEGEGPVSAGALNFEGVFASRTF
jgi:hypothetical protein